MKKFNWEEFLDKNNKIAVHCKTEEEANDFCKQMHEHGMKWKDGDSYLNISCWDRYRDKTSYNNHGGYASYIFYEEEKHTILEWSDYMKKEFTKADLKDGMVVEYRDGKRRLVLNNFLIGKDGYFDLSNYSENLKDKNSSDRDIVRVFKINIVTTLDYIFRTENLELIWERTESKKMTTEEMRHKLEELTEEKIEVEPSREEMIGIIKIYCDNCTSCGTCCCIKKYCRDKEVPFGKCDKETIKKCYKKVMEDGRKES